VSDRTRELSVLFEVAALASQSLDLETTLSQSLEQVLEAVGSDAGVVHLLDEPGGTWSDGMPAEQVLRLAAHRGVPPDLVAAFESLPATEGLGWWIMEHDEPLIMQDLASDPRGKIELPTAYPREAYSYVGIPLRASGRTEGVLGVVRRRDQPQLNVEELSLLASIADQLGVAVESARLRRRAEQAAVLEERERLARDLHDSVSQLLYSMNLFAKSGRNAYNLGDMDELDHCLTELGEAGQQALREMRLLLYELRPRLLEQEGLAGALEHRLDAVERRVGIAAQLLRREVVDLPSEVERDLYHIATEALNNSLKHGQATAVEVSIDVTLERVYLEVSDNGIGYDPGAIEGKGGLGILGIRERAKRLGGTLQVRSAPGEGTRVRIELASDRGDSEQL